MKEEYKQKLQNLSKDELVTIIEILVSGITEIFKRNAYNELLYMILNNYVPDDEKINNEIETHLENIINANESKFVVDPENDFIKIHITPQNLNLCCITDNIISEKCEYNINDCIELIQHHDNIT